MKEAAHKGLVRPVLEYGSSVWDPQTHGLQEELEMVQNRAARFVTGNYVFETGSMTGILGQLKWESLKKRMKDSRLILLYKGPKGKSRIPTDGLIPKNGCCRNQHSLAFQIPSASKEAYSQYQRTNNGNYIKQIYPKQQIQVFRIVEYCKEAFDKDLYVGAIPVDLFKGTSRQRSGKDAIRKRFPLQKPRWEKTKITIRYLYHENIS